MKSISKIGLFATVGFIGAWLILPPSLGSLPSAEGQSQKLAFEYETGVTVKLVQVYVTDRKGNPIADLTPAEFTVTDNGKPVTIEHFEKHFFGNTDADAEKLLQTPQMNRKTFLFFDFAFMDQRAVARAKKAGLHFLDTQLLPTDEIGLLSYSASRGMTVHEYFTLDHSKVRNIVDGFGLRHVAGRAESLTDFVYGLNFTAEPEGYGRTIDELEADEDFYTEQARLQTGYQVDQARRQGYIDQARHFLLTLNQLGKVLRTVPGQKNIVFFSNGIAKQLLFGKTGGAFVGQWSNPEELAEQMQAYDSAQADQGLRTEFTDVTKEFKASGCPIFSIDTSRVQGEFDVETPGVTTSNYRDMAGDAFLRQLAGDTGGKYFGNTVSYDNALENIQNITGAYYILGFTVDGKVDGKFHKIKVKVSRKRTKVLAQGGYYNPKPFKEMSSFERLLHVTDLALGDNPRVQIPIEIPLSAQPVFVQGWMQLAAYVHVPKELAEEVIGKRAEAFLLLFDEAGHLGDIKRFRLNMSGTGEKNYVPAFIFPATTGNYTCRIVIRNMETGRGARGIGSLTVPKTEAVPLWLDEPLLLALDPDTIDLGAAPAATLSSVYSYDKDSYAPLPGIVPEGLDRFFVALRCTSGTMRSELDFEASLVDPETQSRTALSLSVLDQKVDRSSRSYLIEIASGEIAPGKYQLVLVAKERGGETSGYTTSDITVK